MTVTLPVWMAVLALLGAVLLGGLTAYAVLGTIKGSSSG